MSQGVGYPNHYFFKLAIDQFFPKTISRQCIVMVRTGCMPVPYITKQNTTINCKCFSLFNQFSEKMFDYIY